MLLKSININLLKRSSILTQGSINCNQTFAPHKYEGPSAEEYLTRRRKNFSKGLSLYYKEPVMISQGNLQWLWDVNGKRYLDLFGGIVTVSVGHCHPKVNKALQEQTEKLWHTTNIYMYPGHNEYAEKLTGKLPDHLKVCLFVNSGSEANDLAIHLARLYTGRFDCVSLRNGYHGASSNTMGLTSLSTWRYNTPTGLGIHQAMNADPYRGIWGGKNCRDSPVQTNRDCDCGPDECQAGDRYAEQFKEVLDYSTPKGNIAAVFLESIQGVGGAVQFPKNYVKQVSQMVQSNGGLYVADEVQTGFGRTGSHFWGFQNHEGARPDIVTMAKGMGNGFPMAAVVTTTEVADVLAQSLHFNTFGGNPMACAVGSAVLDVIEEEGLQENCKVVGSYFLGELSKLREEFEIIGDVRGKGLMMGLEFVEDKKTRKPLKLERVNAIWEMTKNLGVLFGKGGYFSNVFRIKPPMCITKENVDLSIKVLKEAIVKTA